mmetsp:Transcript_106654/g.299646  ORF Transcript_106654/g.299646 Transcript_106654/m.299646 type:complete len:203 (-) Transcript_106654:171-779(-)
MTTSTTRPMTLPPVRATSCAMLSDPEYLAQLMRTTRDKCASNAPRQSITNPSTRPERLSMKGSDRQPAPIAEDTRVKTPASSEPSPMGSSTWATMREKPTDSLGALSSGVACTATCAASSSSESEFRNMFFRTSLATGEVTGTEKSSQSHLRSSVFAMDLYSRSSPDFVERRDGSGLIGKLEALPCDRAGEKARSEPDACVD